MCNCDDLVLLLLEGLLNLVKLWSVTNRCLQLCDLGTVRLEAVGERIGEVTSVKDEDLIASLSQIGGDLIPSECAGAGDDKGLRGRVGGLEELAQVLEHFAEAIDERLADMGFTTDDQHSKGMIGVQH